MNYLTLCQTACQEARQGQGPTSVTGQTGINGDFVRWIRQAWLEIQRSHEKWKFAWTKASYQTQLDGGGPAYQSTRDMSSEGMRNFDNGTWKIYRLVDGESSAVPLTYLTYDEYKELFLTPGVVTADQPQYITRRPNGDLEFYPTPDDDYVIQVEGYSKPQTLTDVGDIPILVDEGYQWLIIYKALMSFAAQENAPEIMDKAQASYLTLYDDMVWEYLDDPDEIVVVPV